MENSQEYLLQQERIKCISVLNKYNSKYNTNEHQQLRITLDYLVNLLEKEEEEYKKNILIEDISIINTYLM
jgi:hypothetical protein